MLPPAPASYYQQPPPEGADPNQMQPFQLSPYPYQETDTGTANTIQQLNPEYFVEQMEHYLRGEVYNLKEQSWDKRYTEFMNEKGFSIMMPRIRSIVGQLNTLCNYDPQEISNLMLKLSEDVVCLLRKNWIEFGIAKANLPIITGIVMDMSFAALKRGDKTFLRTSHRSHEQIMIHTPQKSGLFGRIRNIPNVFK